MKKRNLEPQNIADIACGGGTLTFHISKIYPKANYLLVDLNPDVVEIAKKINTHLRSNFLIESIYSLKTVKSNYYDIVFNWQTLSARVSRKGTETVNKDL